MTTTASIFAMILDQAYDSKGQFTPSAPIKYIRERFLHTEWKKDYAWRPFLDPLIIGFGDQQLITGYAVLLSGWIKVAQNSFDVQGAHFVLILYICALSSSSHPAALITLRKYFGKYRIIAKIRLTLVIMFALFLFGSMVAAICLPPTHLEHSDGTTNGRGQAQRLSVLVPLTLILIGFSTALVCILHKPRGKPSLTGASTASSNSKQGLVQRVAKPYSRAHLSFQLFYYLFMNTSIAFAVQIVLAMLSVILVLSQKFAVPGDAKKFCGLQDDGENVWGFGQTLSVVMLLLPAMSACHTYLEGRQDISEGFTLKD
ncbi:hypothetical protein J1614_000985 [Plenodomus biglobosus]|nr:hypothetical protein J1614_000985 [Plenodomus biglobosus]